jgi:hypothetical protein
VYFWGHLVYQDILITPDAVAINSAQWRVSKVHQKFYSLCEEEQHLLLRKLPGELQLRSQIMLLDFDRFMDFVHSTPPRQRMGAAQETLERGTLLVPEASAGMPASATASAIKMEPNDDSPNSLFLKSLTSMTQPMNESESHQATDGSAKRKRDGSTFPETAIPNMRPSASNTEYTPVKSARHKGRRRSPKPQKKPASTAQSPLHKHILRQFRYPLNVHDVLAGHIGDDWEEFLLKGEKRVVGWQWLDGYARRVMKSPSTMFSVRPLLRTEELALEKAGLQLDHEDGMGEGKVEVEEKVKEEEDALC